MEQEHLFILDLVETGKITVPEALELIEAVDDSAPEARTPYEQTLTIQLCLN